MGHLTPVLIRCAILALSLLVLRPHNVCAQADYNIVILHSYHKGFLWTDLVQEGIEKTLASLPPGQAEVSVEYMDTKRHAPEAIRDGFKALFAAKYAESPPDVVITSDDNAFSFMRTDGHEVLPDTPVVFCGVNTFKDSFLADLPGFTGVLENFDIAGTLHAIEKVQPNIRHIFVVSDVTTTGQLNFKRFKDAKPQFDGRFDFIELAGLSTEEYRQALSAPPPNSAILLLSFWRDSAGNTYSTRGGIDLLHSFADLPIYAYWDFMMEAGVVGGEVVSGLRQGEAAASMVLRILQGATPNSIPILRESPNQFMFDHHELERFAISEKSLPVGSVVINAPQGLYHRNKKLIWSAALAFCALVALTFSLALNVRRRIKVETELREAERNYRLIFENIPDGFYRTGLDGKVQLLNPAACRLLGYASPDEGIGKNISALYKYPEHRSQFVAQLKAEGRVNGFRTTCVRKDGSTFEVEVNSVMVQDEKTGQPVAVEGLVRDVTERVQIQEFLAQNEKMVSLGGLAAGMAHEINNPLASILHSLQNIERRLTSPLPANKRIADEVGLNLDSLASYMEERGIPNSIGGARACAERAADIVRNMLEFSRKTELSFAICEVQPLVARAVKLLESDFGRPANDGIKNLTVEQRHESGTMGIECIQGDIEQVLFNLLRNASHALSRGTCDGNPPRIVISSRQEDEFVLIEVSDNGPGMVPEQLARVFEPFYTTKPPGEGTGLGLSVSYFIITQKHRGTLTARSGANGGATFLIRLPKHGDTQQSPPCVPCQG